MAKLFASTNSLNTLDRSGYDCSVSFKHEQYNIVLPINLNCNSVLNADKTNTYL